MRVERVERDTPCLSSERSNELWFNVVLDRSEARVRRSDATCRLGRGIGRRAANTLFSMTTATMEGQEPSTSHCFSNFL